MDTPGLPSVPPPSSPAARGAVDLKFRFLLCLVATGVFFNNILRWYPFPEGRSANDLSSLDDTLLGIVVNLTLLSVILVLLLVDRSTYRIRVPSAILGLYCLYIAVQAFFRENQLMETARSASWIVMLVTAERLGTYISVTEQRVHAFVGAVFWSLVSTTCIGLAIALYLPGSVNWGMGISNDFTQSARGEFFFLWIPPVVTAALSTCYLGKSSSIGLRSKVAALFVLATASALCVITLTRTYVFGILLVIFLVLLARTRYAWAGVILVGLMAFVVFPEFLESVLISLRIRLDPSTDFTTGRLDLNRFLLELFSQSPLFGVGAQEMRVQIAGASTRGTTEHGYTSHLASYGIFSLLFLGYLLYGIFASIRLLVGIRRRSRLPDAHFGKEGTAVASLAVFTALTGFVGLLGAASSFGDWLGLLFVAMSIGLGQRLPAADPMDRAAG